MKKTVRDLILELADRDPDEVIDLPEPGDRVTWRLQYRPFDSMWHDTRELNSIDEARAALKTARARGLAAWRVVELTHRVLADEVEQGELE